jgi:hypothetical protein
MVHPAQVSAIPPRYYDTRKSRKNRRSDVMSDDVLKVLLGALGGAALALLLVGAFPGESMMGVMGRMMGSGLFWVLFALLFWVLLVASLAGIRIIVWVFDAAQRR